MQLTYLQIAYLVASILFILSLKGLSSQESAKQGNSYGIIGMAIALIATLLDFRVDQYNTLFLTLTLGALIGWVMAKRVQMTSMPELVALLHSFVGLAAVFSSICAPRRPTTYAAEDGTAVHQGRTHGRRRDAGTAQTSRRPFFSCAANRRDEAGT